MASLSRQHSEVGGVHSTHQTTRLSIKQVLRTNSTQIMIGAAGAIGVIGAGVTGSRVVEHLVATSSVPILLHDQDLYGAQRLAAVHRSHSAVVSVVDFETVATASVVVLACGSPHAPLAQKMLASGASVVSLSDDVSDVMNLLKMHDEVMAKNKTLVVGAAASPGMTGLLLSNLQTNFDEIDDTHSHSARPVYRSKPLCSIQVLVVQQDWSGT